MARFDPMQVLLCAVMVLYGAGILVLYYVTDKEVASWLSKLM